MEAHIDNFLSMGLIEQIRIVLLIVNGLIFIWLNLVFLGTFDSYDIEFSGVGYVFAILAGVANTIDGEIFLVSIFPVWGFKAYFSTISSFVSIWVPLLFIICSIIFGIATG